MARDDSVLYSGMSSASFARVKQERAKVAIKKKEDKAFLQREADVVLSRLQTEIDSIPRQIWDLADLSDTEAHYKATLIALKKYESYLVSLRGEFEHLLKGKPHA